MGCFMSCMLGYGWCRSGCSASRVAAAFAFIPPSPATYTVTAVRRGAAAAGRDTRGAGDSAPELQMQPSAKLLDLCGGWAERAGATAAAAFRACTAFKIRNALGTALACFRFAPPRGAPAQRKRLLLLYSHGNAADCGQLVDFLFCVSRELGIGVCCYDYSGYGASGGEPGVDASLRDIEAVYEHLTQSCGVDPSQLVVYGQSVGSGPSCHLAATRRVGALVLHSAMASGLGVLTPGDWGLARRACCCAPSCCCACVDVFRNAALLRQLRGRVPCLLFHGTADEVIAPQHSQRLVAAGGAAATLHFVDGAGHDDVVERDPDRWMLQLGAFLDALPAASLRPQAGESEPT